MATNLYHVLRDEGRLPTGAEMEEVAARWLDNGLIKVEAGVQGLRDHVEPFGIAARQAVAAKLGRKAIPDEVRRSLKEHGDEVRKGLLLAAAATGLVLGGLALRGVVEHGPALKAKAQDWVDRWRSSHQSNAANTAGQDQATPPADADRIVLPKHRSAVPPNPDMPVSAFAAPASPENMPEPTAPIPVQSGVASTEQAVPSMHWYAPGTEPRQDGTFDAGPIVYL